MDHVSRWYDLELRCSYLYSINFYACLFGTNIFFLVFRREVILSTAKDFLIQYDTETDAEYKREGACFVWEQTL